MPVDFLSPNKNRNHWYSLGERDLKVCTTIQISSQILFKLPLPTSNKIKGKLFWRYMSIDFQGSENEESGFACTSHREIGDP